MATILIAGDLVWDYNIAKTGGVSGTYSEPFDRTVLSVTPGGAWFLREMVKLSLRKVLIDPTIVMSGGEPAPDIALSTRVVQGGSGAAVSRTINEATWTLPVASAFTVWDQFPVQHNPSCEEKDAKSWRVAEFLGCRRAELNENAIPPQEHSLPDCTQPDLVILEDLGLGFRTAKSHWLLAINGGSPKRIVLKLSGLDHENPLLKHLLVHHADRLTIVLHADDLRRRGAIISKGLSWDRTKRELVEEFARGRSADDLARARRVIVALGLEGVASFTRCDRQLGKAGSDPVTTPQTTPGHDCVRERAVFERFLFNPDESEGDFRRQRAGRMFGAASILTAAVARHELEPATYPLFIALGRGMQAARISHHQGVRDPAKTGAGTQLNLGEISKVFHPAWTLGAQPPEGENPKKPQKKTEPADAFKTAFPHYVLSDDALHNQADGESNLLQDVAGVGAESMTALAMSIVLQGTGGTLSAAPKARAGKFFTVDCEEIERISALRNLFETYLHNPKDQRPLSIAVFGQPGSGKSFAVKELAHAVFPDKPTVLEFNLSQFPTGEKELHKAFHRVRDASIKGAVPLVFWDEFDADRLKWLKYFLAPMWDAEFRAGSIVHPIGKCIFVFAGGTAVTFESFVEHWNEPAHFEDSQERGPGFKTFKGPDFVSRLSGYLNIKGPNPADLDVKRDDGTSWAVETTSDPAFVIRRAVLLRSFLERFYPQLLDTNKRARVSAGIVRALLRVRKYVHGARSLEAVLRMSQLEGAKSFSPSQLPTEKQLQLHVTDDLLGLVKAGEVDAPLIEAMARGVHQAWVDARTIELPDDQRWSLGSPRDDFARRHPLLKAYDELTEADKEGNRRPAREVRAKMAEVGLTIRPRGNQESPQSIDALKARLVNSEHDRWLRERLLTGYAWAAHTNDDLRLHADIVTSEGLPPAELTIDAKIVDALLKSLEKAEYVVAPA